MKVAERAQARQLRAEGMSIRAIAAALRVSQSSVSVWVRDVELTPEQLTRLRAQNPAFDRQRRGQLAVARAARERRRHWQDDGRRRARHRDPLHLAGCMLYWAEGTKQHQRLCFVNSDVRMLRLFVRFVRECYRVPDGMMRFSVNCYLGNGLRLEEIEAFWLSELELPRSCLLRATVNRASSVSQRKRRTLPYGTGRVVVHSTAIAQSVYGAIQEYGGFEEPAWLR